MTTNLLSSTVRAIVARFPAVRGYLTPRARLMLIEPAEYKTVDYFLQQVERMVTHVYNNQLGGEFIDIMASLIQGQLTQAFRQAWADEGFDGDLPPYLSGALEEMILSEYTHVDQFYRDIVDARIDETSIAPLLMRAGLWANRYVDAYNRATTLITAEMGGNMVWHRGATEQSCSICSRLNGVVARASEWEELNVRPQNPPNPILAKENGGCGGWQCDCSLEPTEKRRSPKAYETILNIVSR
jgi:hypothetical protein